MRLNNRIIRSSTRLAEFSNEMSSWYEDKIIPTDIALDILGIDIPEEIGYNGKEYIKSTNGYILKEKGGDKDVKRGLYMMSIPSNFIAKCNLTEYAHIYKERNKNTHAAPELRDMIESLQDQIENFYPMFNRELLFKIIN